MLNSRVISHLEHKYEHAADCDGLPAVRRSERISAKNRRGRKAFLLEAEEASDEDDDASVLYDDCIGGGIDVTSESVEGFPGPEEADDDSDSGFISENDDVDDSDASVFDGDGNVGEDEREVSACEHRRVVYDSGDDSDVSEDVKESSACKRRRIVCDSSDDSDDSEDEGGSNVVSSSSKSLPQNSISSSSESPSGRSKVAAKPVVSTSVVKSNVSDILAMQRRQRSRGIDHILWCNGIRLNFHDENWVSVLKLLNEHIITTGDVFGARLGDDPMVQSWVSTQRRKYRDNELDGWRLRILLHIGFRF